MTRDQFLTEKMGRKWYKQESLRPDFSTPVSFFSLWNWAKKQKWFIPFLTTHGIVLGDEPPFQELALHIMFINPDFLAHAIAKYLGWEEEK